MKTYIDLWEKVFGLRRAKRIFIAATRQNVGKTTISLGLISSLSKRYPQIGFIKPVGQRYMVAEGCKVDEDSVLMEDIFHFGKNLKDMSPIAVERGYTEKFLDGEGPADAEERIKNAFERISDGKDLVVIEGTGHAGVGSVFDLSNAAVAKMLDSRVILISTGGIGRAIDEIMLNKSVFDRMDVKLAGVIINKVLPEKYEKINSYVRKGLARLDIPVLGVVPYFDMLEAPTMRDFKEDIDMQVLCGEGKLENQIRKVLVGAMEVREAEQYLQEECLLITPGNRTDLINMLIKVHLGKFRKPKPIAGLILSGGLLPKRRVYDALRKAGIPTLLTRCNTYDIASKVHDLTVKIKTRDKKKVNLAIELFMQYVDVDMLVQNL